MRTRDYIMKRKTAKKMGWLVGALGAVVILVAAYALSWIIACGVMKLITMCFGWTFSWAVATGVWLVMCLASTVKKG